MDHPPTRYRGRFAPSPTGKLHLGHARTYLVAWLRAREARGSIALRIEDLDPPRTIAGAAESIARDLEWLGLDWDEQGVVQSERDAHYEHALGLLQARGLVYPCTCSRREIASIASAPHGAEELGVRYPGTCRGGPSYPTRPAAARFVMPEPAPNFVDLLAGAVQGGPLGGDFVLRRADGLWSYQLAVVVDDIAMGITEVVRGADLLSSTPRQLALHRALGHEPPRFAHVPLVLDAEGHRLAKRSGAISIEARRAAGESAERIIGALAASLGLVPPGTCARPEELVSALSLERLRAAAPWTFSAAELAG